MSTVHILVYAVALGGNGDIVYAFQLRDALFRFWSSTCNGETKLKVHFLVYDEHDHTSAEKVSKRHKNVYRRVASLRPDLVDDLQIAFPNQIAYDLHNCYGWFPGNKIQYDFVFCAPVTASGMWKKPYKNDLKRNLYHVMSHTFPYLSIDCLKTFTVYNTDDGDSSDYDYSAGIGEGHLGIFQAVFDSVYCEEKNVYDSYKLSNLYGVVYIDTSEYNMDSAVKSLINYLEDVITSYCIKQKKNLSIVLQPQAYDIIPVGFFKFWSNKHQMQFLKNGRGIRKYRSGKTTPVSSLNFRTDIMPLPQIDFRCLVQKSVMEILITGNQTVSDVMSCCKNKIIYYQCAEWAVTFARRVLALNSLGGYAFENDLETIFVEKDPELGTYEDWNFERNAFMSFKDLFALKCNFEH
jgi:hypothetical protein